MSTVIDGNAGGTLTVAPATPMSTWLRVLTVMGVSLPLVLLAACSPTSVPEKEPSPTPSIQGNVRDYEYFTALVACMNDRGWPAEVQFRGGGWSMSMEAPNDQVDVAREAERECASEVDGGMFEVTSENAEFAYDSNIRVLDCLRDHGFPTADPPSKSRYVNQFLEDRSSITWDPYAEIPVDERRAAVMTCPQ